MNNINDDETKEGMNHASFLFWHEPYLCV